MSVAVVGWLLLTEEPKIETHRSGDCLFGPFHYSQEIRNTNQSRLCSISTSPNCGKGKQFDSARFERA